MNDGELFVIYLHGFLSSPESRKARQTMDYWERLGLRDRLLVPELGGSPAATMAQIQRYIDSLQGVTVGLIGSSLGGFYATSLAHSNRLRAVLVNPAVHPWRYWRNYLGEHRNYYSNQVHVVTEQHVRELQAMEAGQLSEPGNYLLLANTGDEVLDYRLAETRYQGGTVIIQEGGSHAFENYAEFLPIIFDFLSIKN